MDVNKGAGKPVTISNIAPGYTDTTYRWFDAYNKGTMPGELFMRFVKTAGDDNLYNSLRIELRDGGYQGNCDGNVFYTGYIKDFPSGDKISLYNVHAAVSSIDDVKDNIPANYTMRVCQKVSLPETGTNQNNLQGKSVTFDEQISDMQDAKPDSAPVWP
ncbi:MAG: hypothetical protein QMD77_03830 [Patescibacteria group bacterium]|nr:hypothetical protein [Patescibacteria group bacterium]